MFFDPLSTRSIENFESLINNDDPQFEIYFFKRIKNQNQLLSNKTVGVYIKDEKHNTFNKCRFCATLTFHLLKNPNYDLIVVDDLASYGSVCTSLAKILRIKIISTVHGFFMDEWDERKNYPMIKKVISQLISKISLKYADLFVINDKRMTEVLINYKIPPEKIWERYVCVDPIKFDKSKIDAIAINDFLNRYHVPEKYLLFVGSLNKKDGIEDFLQIIKKIHMSLPNMSYLIIGEGPEIFRVTNFINQNSQINIKYIKHIDYQLMPLVYYNALLTVLPMYPPQAGVGKIILESLSMECPVITSDAGIFHEVIVNDINGYILPMGDIHLFENKILDLIQNQEKRNQWGINGRKIVLEKYSINDYISNWKKSLVFLLKSDI